MLARMNLPRYNCKDNLRPISVRISDANDRRKSRVFSTVKRTGATDPAAPIFAFGKLWIYIRPIQFTLDFVQQVFDLIHQILFFIQRWPGLRLDGSRRCRGRWIGLGQFSCCSCRSGVRNPDLRRPIDAHAGWFELLVRARPTASSHENAKEQDHQTFCFQTHA